MLLALSIMTDVEIEGALLILYMKNTKDYFFCPLLFPADSITQSSIRGFFSLVCPDRLEGRKVLLALAIYHWKKKKGRFAVV